MRKSTRVKKNVADERTLAEQLCLTDVNVIRKKFNGVTIPTLLILRCWRIELLKFASDYSACGGRFNGNAAVVNKNSLRSRKRVNYGACDNPNI